MVENVASGDKGQSSDTSQASGKAGDPSSFFITPTGSESFVPFEGPIDNPPVSPQQEFEEAPSGNEEQSPKPTGKKKSNDDFDKSRQRFDQEAANMRRQNEELTERFDAQSKQLEEALNKINSPTEAKSKDFEPLTADSDVEDLVDRLNKLGESQSSGSLSKQVAELQKQFEKDRQDRSKRDRLAQRHAYLQEMEGYLAAGEKSYGSKMRPEVEKSVAAEMARRGFGEENLPDLYTLELAIEKSFNDLSGGRKKRSAPQTVPLDTGTGGAPSGESRTQTFEPMKLTDWMADAKRRAAAGSL